MFFFGTALFALAACPSTAFVTLEQGRVAAVTWTDRAPAGVKSHSVVNQTLVVDSTLELRPDDSVRRTQAQRGPAGEKPAPSISLDLAPGKVAWSPFVPSTIEQAVLRARRIGAKTVTLPGASLWKKATDSALNLERIDATDWSLTVNDMHYDVLTDDGGCLLSAQLPAYGIVIERRDGFAPSAYPLWSAYGAPPDQAYAVRDVRIAAAAGHVLAGTLTVPKTPPTAAVLFITGISPHERNAGQPPFMPFRDLSDALTRAGVATLRVDDRGVGASTGDHATMTFSDKADDTRTELAWLRAKSGLAPKRVFLLGYSEGGTLATLVASTDPTIAGVVSISGNGVNPWDLYRYQVEIAVNADPSIPPAAKEKEIEKQLSEPLGPHEKEFMALDPLTPAKGVSCPVLIIQGGNDLHVPPRSAERLAAAIRQHGVSDVTVRIIPGVGHMIVPDPIGLASHWPFVAAHLTVPEIQTEVASWVANRARGE